MKRIPEYLLILYSLSATISIGVSQSVMAAGALVALIDRGRHTFLRWTRVGLEAPLFAWVIACLLSSAFATDPAASFVKSKKILLLAMIYWPPAVITRTWSLGRLYMGLLFSAGVTSLYGVTTFFVHGGPIQGFHGFYLTNSGLLLLCTFPALLLAFTPQIATSHRVGAALAAAAILSSQFFGRLPGAWIGTGTGIVYLALRRRLPAVAAIVPVTIVVLLLAPGIFQQATQGLIDPRSGDNQYRLEIWANGGRLFLSDPLTGRGLHDLGPEYASIMAEGQTAQGHMHSVPVHLAASMGLPGLLAYGWLIFAFFRVLARARVDAAADPLLAVVVESTEVGLVAFLAAGLVEWNFGDSEQLALVSFLIGTAIAAGRRGRETVTGSA